MKRLNLIFSLSVAVFVLGIGIRLAHATPSTEFWTPAIMDVQPYGVWHLGIDNYFTVGGSRKTGNFPTDVGLTVGVLPFEKINLEVGADLLEPMNPLICAGAFDNGSPIKTCPSGADGLLFNFKFGIPEGALFAGSPGINAGMFDIGTVKQITNMNIGDLIIGKTIPVLGRVHIGGYLGDPGSALLHKQGDLANDKQTGGVMAAWDRGFWNVKDAAGNEYSKFTALADYASGQNFIGGWGVGLGINWTKDIDILTGPVFFNDKTINGKWKWSTQLDINF
ncbi:MAG TPA: hypothetical protein VLY20_03235 [Nitrospiria bacterium]|nr:hypothetical protein [Nitrospiria bacterium]HUK55653.1 hypothetical protein [Nitrospiria bacterium]